MFTGIIENKGVLVATQATAGGRRFAIELTVAPGQPSWAMDCELGASVAINGVCLTVTAKDTNRLEFDVINETLDKTNLGAYRVGDALNLERSLRVGDRLDGHFVQGHVDGTAVVDEIKADSREWVIWLRPQSHLLPFIVPKGSVAIDGVSLTIAAVSGSRFSVALIPTTLDMTNLGDRKTGDRVNIESDMLVRALLHRMDAIKAQGQAKSDGDAGLTLDALKKAGYS